ncbi:hypothetical protein CAC42_398 [Sphaceloma murrayae]|uniref:Uncharacterized protein n=1 Tax=Sphaceloma murrayae TaxID=2082308 RepID=A0A2K1R3E3_9PEZI|nr:hypothetical protein CAC42_398 [Sphaceloma murrayae]
MPQSTRLEAHLMRQRGAGARSVVPSFGFQFKDVAEAAFASRQASRVTRTPSKKTPVRRKKSMIYHSPTQRTRQLHGDSATPETRAAPTPKSASRKSTAKRTSSAHKPVPPFPAEDEVPEANKQTVRKAKFHEHLSDDEPASKMRLQKPKKTTKRKRRTVTMPKPKSKKAKRIAVEEVPQDPADLAEEPLPEDDDYRITQRGSTKRRHGAVPIEAEQPNQAAKRSKLYKQQDVKDATPPHQHMQSTEQHQLPSPTESGQDNSIKSPPKTTMQRIKAAGSKLFRRDDQSSLLSKTTSRDSRRDDQSSVHSAAPSKRSADRREPQRPYRPPPPPPPAASHPARMKTAPPDELIRTVPGQSQTAMTPISMEEPEIDRTPVRTSPKILSATSKMQRTGRRVVVKVEDDDAEFSWFRKGGRKKKA